MSSFKDYLAKDADIFFNSNEFGEWHNIDGADKLIIIDQDLLEHRKIKYAEGTYSGDLLFYIKKSDLDERPLEDSVMRYDDEPMKVSKVQEDIDTYIITLEATLS